MSGVDTALANIGPRGRRQRLLFGIAMLLVAAAVVFLAGTADISRVWRVTALPLFWLGALGVLQARARTCIAFAARGTCDADAGYGPLTDDQQAALRLRSKRIVRQTTAIAVILTIVGILAPRG